MISFEGVTYSYSGAHGEPAVRDVSFSVPDGGSLAILGANGSGKSTIVRLTNGLLVPHAGRVVVDGIDTADHHRILELRTHVAVVFQRPDDQIVATSVEDEVAFGPENLGLPRDEIRRRVDRAIAVCGLTGLERREPHLLSGGQKQRLAVAGALAMGAHNLVLDEPTAMIDGEGRREVWRTLKALIAEGTTVLLVTHDVVEAALCERAIILKEGRLVAEAPLTALVSDRELLESAGLELPPIARLADRLRALGVPVPPATFSPEEVVGALWRSS